MRGCLLTRHRILGSCVRTNLLPTCARKFVSVSGRFLALNIGNILRCFRCLESGGNTIASGRCPSCLRSLLSFLAVSGGTTLSRCKIHFGARFIPTRGLNIGGTG